VECWTTLISQFSRIGQDLNTGSYAKLYGDVRVFFPISTPSCLKECYCAAEITEAAAASKPKRERKEAFKIDFLSPAEKDLKEIAKELFAPVTRGAGVTLPKHSSVRGSRGKKGKAREKQNDHTLPDDMHFSSRQLVTLFLKPKFSVSLSYVLSSSGDN
jgi:Condensin complex subunit 2